MPGLEKSYNTIRFGMELVKMLGICQMNVKISKIILAIILEENRRRRYDDGFKEGKATSYDSDRAEVDQ